MDKSLYFDFKKSPKWGLGWWQDALIKTIDVMTIVTTHPKNMSILLCFEDKRSRMKLRTM